MRRYFDQLVTLRLSRETAKRVEAASDVLEIPVQLWCNSVIAFTACFCANAGAVICGALERTDNHVCNPTAVRAHRQLSNEIWRGEWS